MLTINKHKIDFPFILAPMAGITGAPFRLLMREMGSAVVISELVSATGLQYESRKTKELCAFFEDERPVGLQIFGEEAEHMARAAHMLELSGVDFIDINLGCPVPKVVNKGAGSAMMKDPTKLNRVLSEIKRAIQIPLTIKIRTGWDSSSLNALECVFAAKEAGVEWVAIHGRTRAQGYEGEANWDFIAEVKSKSPLPIIGNGDVLSAVQAVERLKDSGVDAVMIGRGALRNPFIFQEIAREMGRTELFKYDETTEERAYWKLIERLFEHMKKIHPDYFIGIQMRKFMTWFSAGVDGASQFRRALYSIPTDENNLDQVVQLGREFFDRPNVRKSASYLSEGFLKGGHG